MEKQTFEKLLAGSLYQIPDYQRGYAWENKQINDFIQDIDALVDEELTSHYTGTVVVYAPKIENIQRYGKKRLPLIDIVDGQQRLTTACLYLSVVINELVRMGENEFEEDIPKYLYSGTTCKLSLNNDTVNTFYDLLNDEKAKLEPRSPHEKRLVAAHSKLKNHVTQQLKKRGNKGGEYLSDLYDTITRKLSFTFYTIEEECEIGMTFELMNSRGKALSVLELLKNYLMYWVSRNIAEDSKRASLTDIINKSWKDAYTNIGACNGDEDQCLRIAWILFCSHSPKNWLGYEGFKQNAYIPLRDFSKKNKKDVQKFIEQFSNGLAAVSHEYTNLIKPTKNTSSNEELEWLSKIHNTGNIANFLPLLVAARRLLSKKLITKHKYTSLLKALECYAYRVFLHEGKRSDAGKSNLYRWSSELFSDTTNLSEIVKSIYALIRHYSSEDDFVRGNNDLNDWYSARRYLKYTLYEYELYLVHTEGKGKKPRLSWSDLSDSTIEHILPQTPKAGSQWKTDWKKSEFNECLHDIGNLVLTLNNANYKNFEFSRKKGKAGISPSYSDSDIRQERRLARYKKWTRVEFDKRRKEIIAWIDERWKTVEPKDSMQMAISDEEDEGNI